MRRILVAVLACLTLTGCTHRDPDAVVVWSWDIAARALQHQVPGFYAAYPEFQRYHLQVLDLGHPAVVDRGMAGLAAGGVNLPDVYCMENSTAEVFWNRFPASFVDLASLGVHTLDTDYPSFKWAELSSRGHVFGLPWDSGPVVLFYRRDYFAQAGIDPAHIETWADYAAAGRRLLAWSGGRVKLATMANGSDDEWFRMLLSESGGNYFTPDGRHVTVADPAGVQALSTIGSLAADHLLAYGDWSEQIQLLKEGAVATALYGAWFEGTIRDQCSKTAGQWGVMLMPAFQKGGPRAANIGGSALAIPAGSHHVDVAWAFMQYALARGPSQVQMLQQEGLVPSFLPALKDPWLGQPQAFWGGQAVWSLVLGTLPHIHDTHGSEYFQEARQIVTTIQADYLDGRYPSAAAALDEAARQIRDATDTQ